MSVTSPHWQSSESRVVLHMAMELGRSQWKLLFNTDTIKPRYRVVAAGDLAELHEAIGWAQQRFGCPDAQVVSCYEAGRDGFWIHRLLESWKIINTIVDPSSIEVDQRKRKVKTDRRDLRKLLPRLMRHTAGEADVWRVVRVPDLQAESARRETRELERIKRERTGHVNRIKGLLALHGMEIRTLRGLPGQLATLRGPDGSSLGTYERAEIQRQWERWDLAHRQIRDIDILRRKRLVQGEASDQVLAKVRTLMSLRGVGEVSAWMLVLELFGWRRLRNRREVGAIVGLCGTPFDSGNSEREQGISKAGNRRVRGVMIELAWGWLRWQPGSELSHWFEEHYGGTSKRHRRVGIVALARRLLIALWRLADQGLVPKGAVMTPA